jgi:hypothetical protein
MTKMTEENEQKTNEETALQRYDESEDLAIDLQKMEEGLKTIKQFQAMVKRLTTNGVDYGVIPGTSKPTLLKPGAEKIAKLMQLSDSYQILSTQEDYQKPFFAYTVKCQLKSIRTGKLMSEGLGQCNSYESKYRFRWAFDNQLPGGFDRDTAYSKTVGKVRKYVMYRLDNEDICSQVNTILKMAKKRALVDAALSAGRLSEIFTQDLEDAEKEPINQQAAEFEQEYALDQQYQPEKTMPNSLTTEAQRKNLFALCLQYSVTQESLKKYLQDTYKFDTTAKLTGTQYMAVCQWIETGKQPIILNKEEK